MLRFAANLTYLFKEYPFLERFEAAAEAGFEGVEVLFPYDDAASEIVRRLKRAGLPLVLINTPPPNWTGGERGFAAIPELEERFQQDFRRALRFAERLQPEHIHIMSGVAQGDAARETFVRNLKWAASYAPEQSLTIEPLNPAEFPGYFLNDFELAAEIIQEVDVPNLGLQFDTYHAQLITGDVIEAFRRYADIVRHVQLGGTPNRVPPQDGEADLGAFFVALDALGYVGFVGGEYKPSGRTIEGLDWMRYTI
jgi:hydroxypyruvate isomerase